MLSAEDYECPRPSCGVCVCGFSKVLQGGTQAVDRGGSFATERLVFRRSHPANPVWQPTLPTKAFPRPLLDQTRAPISARTAVIGKARNGESASTSGSGRRLGGMVQQGPETRCGPGVSTRLSTQYSFDGSRDAELLCCNMFGSPGLTSPPARMFKKALISDPEPCALRVRGVLGALQEFPRPWMCARKPSMHVRTKCRGNNRLATATLRTPRHTPHSATHDVDKGAHTGACARAECGRNRACAGLADGERSRCSGGTGRAHMRTGFVVFLTCGVSKVSSSLPLNLTTQYGSDAPPAHRVLPEGAEGTREDEQEHKQARQYS